MSVVKEKKKENYYFYPEKNPSLIGGLTDESSIFKPISPLPYENFMQNATEQEREFVPLFDVPGDNFVYFIENDDLKQSAMVKVDKAVFCKKLTEKTPLRPECHWTDSILVTRKLKKSVEHQNNPYLSGYQTDDVLHKIIEFGNKNIGFYYHPNVGFSVFTRQVLKKNQVICIFSGKLTPSAKNNSRGLLDGTYSVDAKSSLFSRGDNNHGMVDASTFGNFAACLADFPSREQLHEEYVFSAPNIHSNIATDNVSTATFHYLGLPVPVVFATEDIDAYQPLGINYGTDFWRGKFHKDKQMRLLFDKQGALVNEADYAPKQFPVSVKAHSSKHAPRLSFKIDIDFLVNNYLLENAYNHYTRINDYNEEIPICMYSITDYLRARINLDRFNNYARACGYTVEDLESILYWNFLRNINQL